MPNIFRVIGKLIARGDGATDALEVQNSSGTTKLSVADAGRVTLTQDTTVGTQVVSVLTTSTTNAGLVLRPNGTGAIMASAPDGGTGGGNARGARAVDLQMVRGANSQVATGNRAFIGAGQANTASGENSVVCGGNGNTASGGFNATVGGGSLNTASDNAATVSGGDSNTASAVRAVVSGGEANTASGTYSCVSGGLSNTASGTRSVVSGGEANTASGTNSSISGGNQTRAVLYGQRANASGRFAAIGDAQTSAITFRRSITGQTIQELFLDGASIQAILNISSPGPTNARAWRAQIDLVAIVQTVGNGTVVLGECFMGSYHVGIKRIGANTSLVGAVSVTNEVSDTNMATAVTTITADDGNEALKIEFTPPTAAGSTTVTRVVATAYLTEVGY